MTRTRSCRVATPGLIEYTPAARDLQETGKWRASRPWHRGTPRTSHRRRLLASDAAAQVNGQVFHSFGYGYTLLAQPQAIRRIEADRRLEPEELARLFPDTLGHKMKEPPGTLFGKTLNERPPSEWTKHANGVRTWQLPSEEA